MSRNITRHIITLILVFLLALPCAALAQNKRRGKASDRRVRAREDVAQTEAKPKQETVTIPDLVSGQKIIEGTIDYNTVKVALAPGAVVMVEFPARDSILRVHPGDQNLVTVDDTDTKPNFPLVFRPGTGFVVTKGTPEVFAFITVQMASGIPFVFEIYPVAKKEQSATHIFIKYDRDKVVAARRAAGLPVNYKPVPLRPGVYAAEETVEQAAAPALRARGVREEAASAPALALPSPSPEAAAVPSPTPAPPAVTPVSKSAILSDSLPSSSSAPPRSQTRNIIISDTAPADARPAHQIASDRPLRQPPALASRREVTAPLKSVTKTGPAPSPALGGSMRDFMKEVVADAKAFSKYSKPLYGLSVAVSRPKDSNLETRMIVIAVKNTLTESVRLVPGQPDLFVETLDDKKRPVLVEPIQKLGLETTAQAGDLLAPGSTAYYAVAFTPPILGAHQFLRISVSQTTAADSPTSVDLTIKSR